MKRRDLASVAGVAMAAMIAALWFLLIGPKREDASDLGAKVDELRAQVEESERLLATAEAAEEDYGANFRRLVVLGKAVPEDAGTSSLLVEIQGISDDAKVTFDSIALSESAAAAAAAADAGAIATPPPLTPPAQPAAPAEGETPPPESTAEPAPVAETAPAPATETAAATLPLGATVGAAGLPVMPYSVTFSGGFFEIADFLEGLDGLVSTGAHGTGVNGRLLTVDAFSLTPVEDAGGDAGDPRLAAQLAVTTYLTPPDEGLTAGATPGAPPATSATPTPTAATPAP